MSDSTKWVWVPDKQHLFAKALILSESESTMNVRVECTGQTRTINASQAEKVNPPQFDQVGDMAELTYLNEPSVVHNLGSRWLNGRMYTYSGLFLVAVNPYKPLDIYNEQSIQLYKGKKREDAEPHIYAVAEQAFRSMLSSRRNQSILITGESGAGKTENTKKAIQYLSCVTSSGTPVDVSDRSGSGIDKRILQTNPILEAFGNAQTIRNANSSRFGKFIKIQFSSSDASKDHAPPGITGASIQWYLLEKSRVVTQHSHERNYHVFYELLSGASDTLKSKLKIPLDVTPDHFTYLASGAKVIDGVDDSEMFIRLYEAFRIMGFTGSQIDEVMSVVASVLHLGQIKFKPSSSDQGSVVNMDAVTRACQLLGVIPEEFIKSVLQPRVKIGKEFSTQSRTASQAQHTINAVAKALYERLFGYIVEQLNNRLSTDTSGPCIGVLDIAGFEIFEQNSFEQLCINYTNERLQQFFNHHMFVLEQEEYVKEKVDWNYIDYGTDLQPTIDLIEQLKSPMGIFSCLNEECMLASGNEASFNEKLVKQWEGQNSKFSPSRLSNGFKIDHYAQTVEYSTDGWIEKNKDPLSDSVEQVLSTSTSSLIKYLFTPKDGAKAKAKSLLRTVAQRHKEQLTDLMIHLEATQPHFVRCILPNNNRSPTTFNNHLVLDQLRYNGVLEGIRIAQSGFPNRMEFAEFNRRYKPLAGSINGPIDTQQTCATILERIGINNSQCKVGLTKVFFRNGVLADLEYRLEKLIEVQALAIQTISRGALCRKAFKAALHRRQAGKVLAKAFKLNIKNADNPWWQLAVCLKPLLQSKESMNNSKRDVRMQKLETTLQRLKDELITLNNNKNELHDQLNTAIKAKIDLSNALEVIKNEKKAQEEASRVALDELTETNVKLREKYDLLFSRFESMELEWQDKLSTAVQSKVSEAEEKYKLLEDELSATVAKYTSVITELKKELAATNQSIKEQADIHNKTLEDLRNKNEVLSKNHKVITDDHEAKISSLKKDIEAIKVRNSDLEKSHATQTQELEALKSENNDKDCKLTDTTIQLEKAQKDLAQVQGQLKDALAAKTELDELRNVHQMAVSELESKLSNTVDSEKHDKVASELIIVKDDLKKSHSLIKTLKDSSESSANHILEAKHEISQLKSQLIKQREENDVLRYSLSAKENSLLDSQSKVKELSELVSARKSSNLPSPIPEYVDNKTKAWTDSQNPLKFNNRPLSLSGSDGIMPKHYDKRFSLSDAQYELATTKQNLLSAEARVKQLESDLESAKKVHAQSAILRQKCEKLQREKSALVYDRSQLLLTAQTSRGQSREFEIAKAQAADVKRMKSEITVLQLKLARSEKCLREMSTELSNAKIHIDCNMTRETESLRQRMRAAEIANFQFARTVRDLRNQQSSNRSPYPVRPDHVMSPQFDFTSSVEPKESSSHVSRRGISQALQNISNDLRISEQAHADSEHIKANNLDDVADSYRRRVNEFQKKLEKAENAVQTALRKETTAKKEAEDFKVRLKRIEDDHNAEILTLRTQIEEARKLIEERDTLIEKMKIKSSEVSELKDQIKTVNHTLEDISAERDQLIYDKTKLEKKLQDVMSPLNRKSRIHDELLKLKEAEKLLIREQSELRWNLERKDRLLDTLRHNLSTADSNYEKCRAELDRVLASQNTKNNQLRSATREAAEAKEKYLLAQQELHQYKKFNSSVEKDREPVFI